MMGVYDGVYMMGDVCMMGVYDGVCMMGCLYDGCI